MRIDGSTFNVLSALGINEPTVARGLAQLFGDGDVAMPSSNTSLTAGQSVEIPNEASMPNYNQGNTNGCGTTSLAMIMTYLGVPTTQADTDAAMRRMNIFTSPTDMLDYARSKGMEAEGYNNGTMDELKGFIDRGVPVQALITADGSGDVGKMHYVAVVGYGKDASGNAYIKVHDPATGTTKNMPEAEFQQKWSSTPLGFNNYFNAYGKPGTDLPPSRFDGIEGTLAAADGVTNITNGLDRLIHPKSVGDFVQGLYQLPGGIIQTIGGGIGAGIQLGADWLKSKTDKIPFLNFIASPALSLVSGIGGGIGNLFNGFGNAVNKVGGAFGSLFKGDFKGFFGGMFDAGKSMIGGAFDAVGSVAKGAVNAVKSVGEGIVNTGKAVVKFFKGLF